MNIREVMAGLKADMNAIIAKSRDEGRDLTAEEAETIEAKAAEYEELGERLAKAEKAQSLVAQLAEAKGTPEQAAKAPATIGEAVVKSPDFAAFAAEHRGGVAPTGKKSIYLASTNVGSAADFVGRKANITTETGQVPTVREGGYRNALPAEERLSFLDLITVGRTTFPHAEYARIVSETNNAAIVAEGELKPESDITTEVADSSAYVYADGFTISNQTLADDGALAAFMEARVKRHVRGVIEDKALNGTGLGTEPTGILKTTGTLAQEYDEDVIVTLARALEKFEEANGNLDPQAVVMHPRDVWALRLLKDGQGRYLLGNPLEQGPTPTPWGVPLVPSGKVEKGKALVGRFDSFQWLELEPLAVQAFNQHKDYAQRNLVYVRAEARGRQVFYSPRELVVASIAPEMP